MDGASPSTTTTTESTTGRSAPRPTYYTVVRRARVCANIRTVGEGGGSGVLPVDFRLEEPPGGGGDLVHGDDGPFRGARSWRQRFG